MKTIFGREFQKRRNGYELEVKEPGVYQIKFRDEIGVESQIRI